MRRRDLRKKTKTMRTRWIIPVGSSGRAEVFIREKGLRLDLSLFDTRNGNGAGANLSKDEARELCIILEQAVINMVTIQEKQESLPDPGAD